MDQPLPRKAADIHLTLSATRPLGAAAADGVERWQATAQVPGQEPQGHRVGSISVLAVDLLACRDPWGVLDGSNDDIAQIGATVFDEMTGQLAEWLDSRLGRTGSRVLVLDRVELEPAWQGQGVAALLVAETLERMRLGVRVALCLPAPLHRGQEPAAEYAESLRRMQQVWDRVGFTPLRDGVWALEPNRDPFRSRLEDLRALHEVA